MSHAVARARIRRTRTLVPFPDRMATCIGSGDVIPGNLAKVLAIGRFSSYAGGVAAKRFRQWPRAATFFRNRSPGKNQTAACLASPRAQANLDPPSDRSKSVESDQAALRSSTEVPDTAAGADANTSAANWR